MLAVGQLVELVNQPPNYGRSLDGTLARVEWVPRVWSGVVFVEIYRTHRRTGKPLKLKSFAMSAEQLKPIDQPNAAQAMLLESVEPLRQAQRARREKMKEDRLLWEKGILDMGTVSPGDIARVDNIRSAREGIALLRQTLAQSPPEGVSASQLADFFGRHEESLVVALATLIDGVYTSSKEVASAGTAALNAADLREAADAHAARLASPLWDSETDSVSAWAATLKRPTKLAASNGVLPIENTPLIIMSISALIEEGYEFKIQVEGQEESLVTLTISPDFDGLYVRGDEDGIEFKLDSLDAFDLLAFVPTKFPTTSGGSITAWTEGSAWHYPS